MKIGTELCQEWKVSIDKKERFPLTVEQISSVGQCVKKLVVSVAIVLFTWTKKCSLNYQVDFSVSGVMCCI